jgi:hypothetical protein
MVVGVDDFCQARLPRAVAAVGVRMEALDQFLVARLDLDLGGSLFETQRIERFAGGFCQLALFFLGLALGLEAVLEQAKQILGLRTFRRGG